jgi:hypothetical protein
MARFRRRAPALTLFFLAPAIGELLSGSSPPSEFFSPPTLLLLAVLYGGGALLIRELRCRWHKGWPTVLLLGAAYGLVEEGLMVKSFFDPHWVDIGLLGSYGRWAGVNWVWAFELTLFHAVFSIAVPILLTERLFPERQSDSWVGRRMTALLSLLLIGDILLGFLALTPYRPPFLPYVLTLATVIGFAGAAQRLPVHIFVRPPDDPSEPVMRLRVIGFIGTLTLFALSWAVPNTGAPALLNLWLMAGLPLAVFIAVTAASRGRQLSERQSLGLVSGGMGFFVLLAPLQQLSKNRADDTSGMAIVGLLFLVGLILLELRFRRTAADPALTGGAVLAPDPPRG